MQHLLHDAGDQSTKTAESEEDRRKEFINSLLNSTTVDVADESLSEKINKYNNEENEISTIPSEDAEAESTFLCCFKLVKISLCLDDQKLFNEIEVFYCKWRK